MLRVYLETTIFNRFLEDDREYNTETKILFEKIAKKEIEAYSSTYVMDCIVSLNFHHINKLKTKIATEIIHRMKGYNSPFICTPMEVMENE